MGVDWTVTTSMLFGLRLSKIIFFSRDFLKSFYATDVDAAA